MFIEVEGQGAELEKIITTDEQCLEGPIHDAVIQEFTKKEVVAQQQVEEDQSKLEAFEAKLVRP